MSSTGARLRTASEFTDTVREWIACLVFMRSHFVATLASANTFVRVVAVLSAALLLPALAVHISLALLPRRYQ